MKYTNPAIARHLKQAKAPPPKSRSLDIDGTMQRAKAYHDAGKLGEAEKLCLAVLAHDPGNPRALLLAGSVARSSGDLSLALQFFGAVAARQPRSPGTQIVYADALEAAQEFDKAIKHFQQVVSLTPNSTPAMRGLARCYTHIGKADLSLQLFEKVLQLDPDDPLVRVEYANSLTSLGHMDDAARVLQESIARGHRVASSYRAWASTREFASEPAELAAIMRELRKDRLTAEETSELNQAAGKILDDLGRHDEAIDRFQSRNTDGTRFDLEIYRKWFDQIIETFNPEMISRLGKHGAPSEAPVFVVGMPRSGTTLTEQIMASHPDVHGAGERKELWDIAQSIGIFRKHPASIQRLQAWATPDHSRTAAGGYLSAVLAGTKDVKRVVDKMPHNFELIGLILLLFPNARIVHCRRDAIDNCLSCYFQVFAEGSRYNTDLTTVGLFYREYDRLMRHWQSVYPGRIYERRYEDAVADEESETRRLIDYLGLPWDDACLRFHETARSVNTPSRWQVRQPIYGSSVKRWKKYGSRIQPLIDALGDLAEV
ncbi:MAG: sulfotransferase [Hyphomicrobiales bacterium]|nr:sulfotransferase [Hyphomicrobiales bacterium]